MLHFATFRNWFDSGNCHIPELSLPTSGTGYSNWCGHQSAIFTLRQCSPFSGNRKTNRKVRNRIPLNHTRSKPCLPFGGIRPGQRIQSGSQTRIQFHSSGHRCPTHSGCRFHSSERHQTADRGLLESQSDAVVLQPKTVRDWNIRRPQTEGLQVLRDVPWVGGDATEILPRQLWYQWHGPSGRRQLNVIFRIQS